MTSWSGGACRSPRAGSRCGSRARRRCARTPGSVASSSPARAPGRGCSSGRLGVRRELGADLAHPVAQGDHAVEALAGELARGAWTRAPAMSMPALAHHPHRVGVQRLRMAAGAARLDRAAGRAARAAPRRSASGRCCRCTGTARARRAGRGRRRRGGGASARPGCSARAGAGQQLAAAREVERVVGVAAVGRAAARRHEAAVAELAQVVRDQVLRLADQRASARHPAVAAGQLAQQPPAQRVSGQLQETRRRALAIGYRSRHRHQQYIESI